MTPDDPLSGYGTKYALPEADPDRPVEATPIRRYPIVYSPQSNTKPNRKALPPAGELAKMELAERELPFPRSAYREKFREAARGWARWSYGWSTFAVALLGLGEFDVTTWALGVWLFVAGVVVAFGHHPVEFTAAWLYSHPRLTPTTRAEHPTKHPPPAAPSLTALASVLAAVVVLPHIAPVVAGVIFGGLGVVAAIFLRRSPLLDEVLPMIVGYGASSSGAPGVWVATRSMEKRRQDLAALVVFLTAAGVTVSVQLPGSAF